MTEHLLQHRGIGVFTVLCREEKGDGAFFCIMPELFDQLLLGSQFTNVTVPEIPSFRWVMAEPGAQPVARRDVPQPLIDMQVLLFNPPRPQPVDKYPFPVVRRGRFVDTLYLYHIMLPSRDPQNTALFTLIVAEIQMTCTEICNICPAYLLPHEKKVVECPSAPLSYASSLFRGEGKTLKT